MLYSQFNLYMADFLLTMKESFVYYKLLDDILAWFEAACKCRPAASSSTAPPSLQTFQQNESEVPFRELESALREFQERLEEHDDTTITSEDPFKRFPLFDRMGIRSLWSPHKEGLCPFGPTDAIGNPCSYHMSSKAERDRFWSAWDNVMVASRVLLALGAKKGPIEALAFDLLNKYMDENGELAKDLPIGQIANETFNKTFLNQSVMQAFKGESLDSLFDALKTMRMIPKDAKKPEMPTAAAAAASSIADAEATAPNDAAAATTDVAPADNSQRPAQQPNVHAAMASLQQIMGNAFDLNAIKAMVPDSAAPIGGEDERPEPTPEQVEQLRKGMESLYANLGAWGAKNVSTTSAQPSTKEWLKQQPSNDEEELKTPAVEFCNAQNK